MLFISDAYLFYYEIAKKLNKKVEIFCNDKPQIPVTDEFYSHVHVYSMDKTFQFTDYLNNDENFDIKVEYRTQFRPINRSAADIYISTNGKRILFCEYMKLNSIILQNFKGIDNLEIKLDNKTTVIFGVNGVGKSTILQAIDLLYADIIAKLKGTVRSKTARFNEDFISYGKSAAGIKADFV